MVLMNNHRPQDEKFWECLDLTKADLRYGLSFRISADGSALTADLLQP